jgi:16S rRNA (guanine527-N7)-methyltransferase
MTPIRTAGEFAEVFDVSRETIARLEEYERQLRRWTPKINLVSDASLEAIWSRHFADSAQLLRLSRNPGGTWADLGSGAGFPGMVIAVLSGEVAPERDVVLVESDSRKAAFLTALAREIAPDTRVVRERAELLPPIGATTVSARALAPLRDLLPLATRHLAPGGECLFLKGARAESELTEARQHWIIGTDKFPSMTDPNGVVLRIGDITRV